MRNPMARLLVLLLVLLGAAVWAGRFYREHTRSFESRLDLERIRREYLERAPLALAMVEPARYAEERRALGRWYLGELEAHQARFALKLDPDRFLAELDERRRANGMGEDEHARYIERFQYVRAWWDRFAEGQGTPIFTGQAGGLRFDIDRAESIPDAREPKLRLHFTLHGAQRRLSVEQSGEVRVTRRVVNAGFEEFLLQGKNADGRVIRELRATGAPFHVENPERFVAEAPPGVVVGYYEIPKIPADVASAELTFRITTRSVVSGLQAEGLFVWPLPAIAAEWKLPPGVGWEGEQEEIRE